MVVRLMVRKRSWGAWTDLGLVEESLVGALAEVWKKDGWKVLLMPVAVAA
jgi:hypothetical protein